MPGTKIWPSPKLVVIGGGTGTSSILPGLKKYTDDITAIISVYDDGGSTGRLRKDLNILAPGDIRSCLLALSDNEILNSLLSYRFKEGELKGHNFGNIFLAAMNEITGDFGQAIKDTSKILNITGKVLPITLENAKLIGELENGKKVVGESEIPQIAHKEKSRIKRIYTLPTEITMVDEAKKIISDADIILLGPGSLYTSVIPNLLAKDMVDYLVQTKGKIVYIANIMTQPGESENYGVKDHYQALVDHSKSGLIDYIVINNQAIDEDLKAKYKKESADEIILTKEERSYFNKEKINLIEAPLVKIVDGKVRHDADKLADLIFHHILKQ